MKNKDKNIKTNNSLLSIITPLGIRLKRNRLIIGENLAKIYGLVKYPGKVSYGWLSKLMNISETVATITYEPIDSGEFIESH